ncbi:MAG TPA: type IV secretion protein IcmD [Gammaproteobacteria bacterium]|nr:type IV secretion protein IcmD [Gammaproteobacteria bacterium]
MMSKQTKKGFLLLMGAVLCLCAGSAFAIVSGGVGGVATNVIGNLSNVAKLITAGSYVAGFGFAVAAIVKFKAHKDNPTQIAIGMPIALLFVGAALIFIPSVFSTAGITLFGAKSGAGTISGVDKF